MRACMFPGQGSQARGMGKNLFNQFPELTEQANERLGYSIKDLCLKDPRRKLSKTQFTQPALYVVNALSYLKYLEENDSPDVLLGHSLGEFNALLAAECFDFDTGLQLVIKRGELMSQASGGAMAAILNGSETLIKTILQEAGIDGVDLANFNTPSQIVISGKADDINRSQSLFQKKSLQFIPLNTSGAFHSRYMEAAMKEFESFIADFNFASPKIPVISNVSAQPYADNSLQQTLAAQIASAVRWADSIAYLAKEAAAKGESLACVEVGHGEVLTKMIAKIRGEAPEWFAKVEPVLQSQPQPEQEQQQQQQQQEPDRQPVEPQTAPFADLPDKATALVNQWNAQYPVGTKVKSQIIANEELETRTKAMVLFGHRAAVYLKGYKGYFDLTELSTV